MPAGFLDSYLPYLLRQADQLLSAAFYEALADYEVTQSEWRVLAVLHERGSSSIRELTDVALSPQPTITHAVARLEDRGLVERIAGEHDRRQRFVSVTKKGKALAAKLIADARRLEESTTRDRAVGDTAMLTQQLRAIAEPNDSPESTARCLARPRGLFPHVRVTEGLAFVSGTSSRRPDNTFVGVEVDELGATSLDIGAQTTAVLHNIEAILDTIGLNRWDLVDATVFLVSMNDFGGYNEAWAEFFGSPPDGGSAPARTTVAVHQLPHPHLLIEIKATAAMPSEMQ